MVTITTALTTVIWYGPGIALSQTLWASKSVYVRLVNGSGYSSFDPAPAQASFNSLQSVATGQVLIVESLASAYSVAGGYQLDNGTAPTGTAPAATPISWPSFSDAGTGPATPINGIIDVSQSYTPAFAFTSGTGTLQMQLNGSGSWVAPALVAPGNSVQLQILNTAAFAGVLTLNP